MPEWLVNILSPIAALSLAGIFAFLMRLWARSERTQVKIAEHDRAIEKLEDRK